MKVACLDKTASDRVDLQNKIELAYENCRASVGHLKTINTYPASLDEILINEAPNLVICGPSFSLEESYAACREVKDFFPEVPIIVFLSNDKFSLRSLRRFQRVADEIFQDDEQAIKIVHVLSSIEQNCKRKKSGKLITVQGVKGGVGTTSITAALAHASESIGKTAVIVDLSKRASLIQFMSAQKWQSADYTACILDQLTIEKSIVEKCVTTAPNGVSVLLPPSGGNEVREIWLRDPNKFEISLRVIDELKEMYDLVIIDQANVEGVLPFSLDLKADSRILITSNDPSSIHLLNATLSEIKDNPGEGNIHILVNSLVEKGLTKKDISLFLENNPAFTEEMNLMMPIKFDPRGQNWIGTGNTFYTESTSEIQNILDENLSIALLEKGELERRATKTNSIYQGIQQIKFSLFRKKKKQPSIRALPAPEDEEKIAPEFNLEDRKEHTVAPIIYPGAKKEILIDDDLDLSVAENYQSPIIQNEDDQDVETPREKIEANKKNEKGSISLEHSLILAATVLLTATANAGFFTNVRNYLLNFFN